MPLARSWFNEFLEIYFIIFGVITEEIWINEDWIELKKEEIHSTVHGPGPREQEVAGSAWTVYGAHWAVKGEEAGLRLQCLGPMGQWQKGEG